MKFKTRYELLNGNDVCLLRKVFWFWTRYEPFVNKLRKKEAEMNEFYHKFVKAHDEYRALLAERRGIIEDIDGARGEKKGYGRISVKSLPLFPFRKAEAPVEPDSYRLFAKALKGVGSVAQTVAEHVGVSDVRSSIPSHDYSPENKGLVVAEGEIIGHTTVPIRRQSNNQQKKQQNNNQQNN